MFFEQYVLGLDDMTSSNDFNLEVAVKQFKLLVRPEENLLNANLVRYLI